MPSEGQDEAWAKATAAEIRKKSPTSLKVAFAQMQRGKTLGLADALRLKFRLASQLIARPDYREGIAARSSAKAASHFGSPATLSEVDDAAIERLSSTKAPTDELELART